MPSLVYDLMYAIHGSCERKSDHCCFVVSCDPSHVAQRFVFWKVKDNGKSLVCRLGKESNGMADSILNS